MVSALTKTHTGDRDDQEYRRQKNRELEKGLLQAAAGPHRRLGTAKQSAAALFNLAKDDQYDGYRYQDLYDI